MAQGRVVLNLQPGSNGVILVRVMQSTPNGTVYSGYASTYYSVPGTGPNGSNLSTINATSDVRLLGGSLYAGYFPLSTGSIKLYDGDTSEPIDLSSTESGVILNKYGIAGFKNGISQFVLDAETGDAVFAGKLKAASGTFTGSINIGSSDYWRTDGSFQLGGSNGIHKAAGNAQVYIGNNVVVTAATNADTANTSYASSLDNLNYWNTTDGFLASNEHAGLFVYPKGDTHATGAQLYGAIEIGAANFKLNNSSGSYGEVLTSNGAGGMIWSTPAQSTTAGNVSIDAMNYWNATNNFQARNNLSGVIVGSNVYPTVQLFGNIEVSSAKFRIAGVDGTVGQVLTSNGSSGTKWSSIDDTLPTQSGNSGKYLKTDGTNATWQNLDLSSYSPTSLTIDSNNYWDSSGFKLSGHGIGILTGSSPSISATGATETHNGLSATQMSSVTSTQIYARQALGASPLSDTYNAFWSSLTLNSGVLYLNNISLKILDPVTSVYSAGTNGQVLTSTGSGLSWTTLSINSTLPDQTGNAGKFLYTNGTSASWAVVDDILPSQSGAYGMVLRSNGTTSYWSNSDINFRNVSIAPSLSTDVPLKLDAYAIVGGNSSYIQTWSRFGYSETVASMTSSGQMTAASFIKTGGTSSQFLKANGSVDSTLYAPLASPTFTGTVNGITKSMVGLGNVDNTSDTDKPISTATQTALDSKASLFSPTFTGSPTAPTPAVGQNTTEIATTQFVKTAIDNLINSAPGALDTLGEIASQLSNDESVVSALTITVSSKAPINSPTFTGTVTLPAGTVTSAMILNGTIVAEDISPSANIGPSQIAGTAITQADIGTVTSTMIVNGTIVNADINASAAIDWSKLAISSTVSSTEIGYLDGVTSDIQAQINSKLSSSTASTTYATIASPTFTGTVTIPSLSTGSGTGTNGQVLTSTGSGLSWSTLNINNTLPDQTGYNGYFLSTNGTSAFWSNVLSGLTTSSLSIQDSLIYLANNNFTTNNMDIGFYGAYGSVGHTGDPGHYHAGFIRNHSTGWWEVFDSSPEPSGNTISGYSYANFQAAIIRSYGGFKTGSTTMYSPGGYSYTMNGSSIDTNATSSFSSIEYTLTIKQSTKIRVSKILVVSDGITSDFNEYSVMIKNGDIDGIAVLVENSGSDTILKATATGSPSATVSFTKILTA